MNIAVYCGSSAGGAGVYTERAGELGRWIGEAGHTLVYGGSNTGLMGAVADGALGAGGRVVGVMPGNVPLIMSRRHAGLTEAVVTDSIAERRSEMIRRADAFIALPGGLGTLDEISEILSLESLGLVRGPVVLYDVDGYYGPLRAVLENILDAGFGRREYLANVLFSDDLEEIGQFLDGRGPGSI